MKISDIPHLIKTFWKFVTEDLWRVIPSEISQKRRRGYNLLKVISLAVRRYQADNLQRSASALTYSTFLSIIPLIAVLLAIAKGFGFQNIIESQLFEYFPGQREVLVQVLEFANSYMEHTKDGLFLGLGLLLLLYTVYNLISSIEDTFNMIWQVPQGRSYLRRYTDYFSGFLLLPILLVCSSGFSIFFTASFDTIKKYELLAPVYEVFIAVIPIIITIFVFTAVYMFMPNTKVQFKHAFYAGIFAGIGFHIFQFLYVGGQIWVSKYNAIYGSFAFLPLFLLWMQLSWVICLIGAEIAYAGQNVQNYEFEADSVNISRRYLDFLTLTITTLIVKRFVAGEKPYTAMQISQEHKIPIRLTTHILYYLMELGVINEIKDEDSYSKYQPGIDINKLSLSYFFSLIDQYGSENFRVDNEGEFLPEWQAILKSREDMFAENKDFLIRDL